MAEDTRYEEVRRFGLIPSKIKDWKVISRSEYQDQINQIKRLHDHLDQVLFTFYSIILSNNYFISIPENFPRELQFMIRKAKRTANRNEYTEKVTPQNIDGFIYNISSIEFNSKKYELMRSHFRQLNAYIDRNLRLFEYENVKKNISVDYLIYNKYGKSLDSYIEGRNILIEDIGSQIERFKY